MNLKSFNISMLNLSILLSWISLTLNAQDIIQSSRANCVKIESSSAGISGTGFLYDAQYVATCFHVVASITAQDTITYWHIFQDLRVILSTGDTVDAKCVSPPTKKDLSPLISDFAVLKLSRKQFLNVKPNPIATVDTPLVVGSEIYFSGYPLATPAMVTHKGMISGISADSNIICIQAPVNKGNSGGALLNAKGEVIGIISMREGGISQGLVELNKYIQSTESHGSVQLMGVDPLQATKEIINVLDTYISTGIGYARSIKFLRKYLKE
ncbi:MAG: serine protease [Bacteroidota bacterium]|jgi:S1-C subfamily serine protease